MSKQYNGSQDDVPTMLEPSKNKASP